MNLIVSDKVKKTLKTILCIIIGVLAILYASFLFIVPNVVNLNNFMPEISREIQKQTGLILDIKNPKIHTTFKLGAGLKADYINIKYDNKTDFITLKAPVVEINLPTLLIGHINIDKIYTKEGNIYLAFTKDKKYTLQKYIELMLTKENDSAQKEQAAINLPFKINNINTVIDNFTLFLKDENLSKTYVAKFNGTKVHLYSINGPLKIESSGFIGSITDKAAIEAGKETYDKYIIYDINLKSKLPNLEELIQNSEQIDKKEENTQFEFNFNPFAPLDKLGFRANAEADLNIKNIDKDDFKAKGYIKINGVSLKLKNIELPESYMNLDFDNKTIKEDAKIYLSKDEYYQTNSTVKMGKKIKFDVKTTTTKISFESIKNIIGAALDIASIPNNAKNILTTGYLKTDINLKSDLKKIESQGSVVVSNGSIKDSKTGLNLSDMKANINFAHNNVIFEDTSALVNGAKLLISGKILSNYDISLKINSDPIGVKDLINIAKGFKLFNDKDIADYQINNGTILFLVNASGNFNNIEPTVDISLNSFDMLIKSLKMPVSIDKISITAKPEKNSKDGNFKATIKTKNVIAKNIEPKLIFSLPELTIEADSKNITIKPAKAQLQGTLIQASGLITEYMKKPLLDLQIAGKIHPNTILAFIPSNMRKNVSYKGMVPYSTKITGALDDVKINGNSNLSPSNYLNIIDIQSLRGISNDINFNIQIKDDTVNLDEITLVSNGSKKAYIKGKIEKIYTANPILNNVHISVPSKMRISIPMLDNMSMMTDVDINLAGSALLPIISGHAYIDNLNYSLYKIFIETLKLNFNKTSIEAGANGIKVSGSDFAGNASISTNFSKNITINQLNYNSNYIDADALMKLAAEIDKASRIQGHSSTPSSKSKSTTSNIGIILKSGSAKINKLKSGTIIAQDIAYNHTIYNDTYYLNDLNCLFGSGTIKGKASYNLANGKTSANMTGSDISMKDGIKALVGKELVKSGTLNGNINIVLSGATYEQQMKSLKGTAVFNIQNGQFGDNIRFERFLGAANVLTQGNFSSSIDNILSKVKIADTSQFKTVTGKISFANGWASVKELKSQGPDMSLYAKGTYGILNNNANLKVTGRISTRVSSMLGPIGKFSTEEQITKVTKQAEAIVNKAAGALQDKLNQKLSGNNNLQAGLAILGAVKNATQTERPTSSGGSIEIQKTTSSTVSTFVQKKINPLFGAIDSSDLANIPALSGNNESGNSFQVYIKGPVSNPKSVKSFKWSKGNQKAE